MAGSPGSGLGVRARLFQTLPLCFLAVGYTSFCTNPEQVGTSYSTFCTVLDLGTFFIGCTALAYQVYRISLLPPRKCRSRPGAVSLQKSVGKQGPARGHPFAPPPPPPPPPPLPLGPPPSSSAANVFFSGCVASLPERRRTSTFPLSLRLHLPTSSLHSCPASASAPCLLGACGTPSTLS
jgi:hypothetical protein